MPKRRKFDYDNVPDDGLDGLLADMRIKDVDRIMKIFPTLTPEQRRQLLDEARWMAFQEQGPMFIFRLIRFNLDAGYRQRELERVRKLKLPSEDE